ncbi:hypothetical protein LCM10_04780 [Rossellomorea aquimaris]|uniref:hypothetical protein n=1 Tax=Rossellomorea aquimaris TaxID=189382 RepID=UPI001CD2E986|nr:hypothetical protein [Rossellomorea aquimaris]MCA1054294.1 hypothetical protein [Rossellomorea aquimaris]
MHFKIDSFVLQESIKELTEGLINAKTDTEACNLLVNVNSIGELNKVKAFINCQKKEIGNNFSAFAIFISVFALLLPALEKLLNNSNFAFIILSLSLSLGFGLVIFREGIPFINKTNEYNSKIDYIVYLINEEISSRDSSA